MAEAGIEDAALRQDLVIRSPEKAVQLLLRIDAASVDSSPGHSGNLAKAAPGGWRPRA